MLERAGMQFALFHVTFVLAMLSLGSAKIRFSTSLSRGRTALRMAFSESKTTREVLVAIADGSEEIEAVTIVDTLVRSGAKVTLASVSSSLHVTCSRGVKIVADRLMVDCVELEWDLM